MPIPSLAALKHKTCQPCAPTGAFEIGDPNDNPGAVPWQLIAKIAPKLNPTEDCPICYTPLFYCQATEGFQPYGPYNVQDPNNPKTVEDPENLRRCKLEMLRPARAQNPLSTSDTTLREATPYFDGTYTGSVIFLDNGTGYHKTCIRNYLLEEMKKGPVEIVNENGEYEYRYNGYRENEPRHFFDPVRNELSYKDICSILSIEPTQSGTLNLAETMIRNTYEYNTSRNRRDAVELLWKDIPNGSRSRKNQTLMDDLRDVHGKKDFSFARVKQTIPTVDNVEPLGEAVSQARKEEYEQRIDDQEQSLRRLRQEVELARDALTRRGAELALRENESEEQRFFAELDKLNVQRLQEMRAAHEEQNRSRDLIQNLRREINDLQRRLAEQPNPAAAKIAPRKSLPPRPVVANGKQPAPRAAVPVVAGGLKQPEPAPPAAAPARRGSQLNLPLPKQVARPGSSSSSQPAAPAAQPAALRSSRPAAAPPPPQAERPRPNSAAARFASLDQPPSQRR